MVLNRPMPIKYLQLSSIARRSTFGRSFERSESEEGLLVKRGWMHTEAMKVNKLSIFFQKNPIAKTIVFAVSVVLSGVLASAFVSDISFSDGLHWGEFYKKRTFWLIVIYLIIVGIYNYFIYQIDVSVEKFIDKDYSRAYIFRACLPDFVEKCREEINSGKGLEGVKNLNDFLKTM